MTPSTRTRLLALALLLVGAVLALAVFGLVQNLRGRDDGNGGGGSGNASGGDATPAPTATSTSAPTPTGTASGLRRFYEQRLDWQSCSDTAQCATLQVPIDYDRPDGRTIGLALLRVQARDQDSRIGSLVVNPGGPGGSGVDYAAAADFVVTDGVRDRYDVVGFDPRGVARSAPVDCLTDRQLDEFLAADGSPDTPAEVQSTVREVREFARGCASRTPRDLLANVGTVDVAKDLDVLRGALGDEQLHYLGKSYGTFIGAEYARQFPTRVGRVVLDGAVDPRLTSEQFALGQARGFEQAYRAFAEDCVEQDECPLGRDVDAALATTERLLAEIDARPLPGAGERRLTQGLALIGIAYPLYADQSQGYPVLRDALREALDGQGAGLLQLADAYAMRRPNGTYEGNGNEAIYAVNCVDREEQDGSVAAAEAAVPRFSAVAPIFGPFLAWGGLACGDWPVPPTLEPAPVRAPGAPPIVVVGTTGDPATPYAWAQGLAEQLESGVLLTYEGFVHTAYAGPSECIDESVDTYLLEGTPPADGTRCD